MTPSWSHQMHSIVFRPKRWSWGRCWWLGINPRFLAFRILKIDLLFIACHNPMQERFSFLSGKQNLACVLASLHLPIVQFSAAPIFRFFEPSPWHVATWKWLLEKHPIVQQAFFAIGYRPRPKELAIDNPQSSWADFHASYHSGQNCRHWTGDTNLCTLFPIKHCRHRPPQASMRFGSRFLQIETEKQSFPTCFFF